MVGANSDIGATFKWRIVGDGFDSSELEALAAGDLYDWQRGIRAMNGKSKSDGPGKNGCLRLFNIMDDNYETLVSYLTLGQRWSSQRWCFQVDCTIRVCSCRELFDSKLFWELLSTNPCGHSMTEPAGHKGGEGVEMTLSHGK